MRGDVPQGNAHFQLLMNGAVWNKRELSGIGRKEQECAWMLTAQNDPIENAMADLMGAVIIFF